MMICNYCGCEEYDIIAKYTRFEKKGGCTAALVLNHMLHTIWKVRKEGGKYNGETYFLSGLSV